MADEDRDGEDSWWRVSSFVDDFNESRMKLISSSSWKCLDESIFAFRPRMTKTGGLPHLVYIFRKPEPFGIELKVVCDPPTGCVIGVEIQEGKDLMRDVSLCFLFFVDTIVLRFTQIFNFVLQKKYN